MNPLAPTGFDTMFSAVFVIVVLLSAAGIVVSVVTAARQPSVLR